MATTIPPVHNYESQIVFSNQSNNIKSTDVINWTIAPSGDDVYFNLYKSRMTFKLKITGLANNAGSSSKDIYVPVKKNMSGIVNNTKVTYTYWNGENLASLPLSADNENIGQIRSLLNALTDNKHNNVVNEGLKELSYIYYDDRDYDTTDKTARTAAILGRPYGGKLFYNMLKFVQPPGSTTAYTTINVNFADILQTSSKVVLRNDSSISRRWMLRSIPRTTMHTSTSMLAKSIPLQVRTLFHQPRLSPVYTSIHARFGITVTRRAMIRPSILKTLSW